MIFLIEFYLPRQGVWNATDDNCSMMWHVIAVRLLVAMVSCRCAFSYIYEFAS